MIIFKPVKLFGSTVEFSSTSIEFAVVSNAVFGSSLVDSILLFVLVAGMRILLFSEFGILISEFSS